MKDDKVKKSEIQKTLDVLDEGFRIPCVLSKPSYTTINLYLLHAYALMHKSARLASMKDGTANEDINTSLSLAEDCIGKIDTLRNSGNRLSIPKKIEKAFSSEIDSVRKKVADLKKNHSAQIDLSTPLPYFNRYKKIVLPS